MNFYLIGINYKTTSLISREQASQKRSVIENFCKSFFGGDVAALATCNRFEIYGTTHNPLEARIIYDGLRNEFPEIFERAYLKENTPQVVLHAMRLACGLESQIIGEAQIVKQLKVWIQRDCFPVSIKEMWEAVLDWALEIRPLSAIDIACKDIADFVLEDLEHSASSQGGKILVIGTGKVAELISQKDLAGFEIYFAARKRHSRARKLAKNVGGQVVLFEDLPNVFGNADSVISATSSPHGILDKKDIAMLIRGSHRTHTIYDLAMPRDIDPEVGRMENVILINLDDFLPRIENYNDSMKPYVKRAEEFIKEAVTLILGSNNGYTYQSGDKTQFACVEAS